MGLKSNGTYQPQDGNRNDRVATAVGDNPDLRTSLGEDLPPRRYSANTVIHIKYEDEVFASDSDRNYLNSSSKSKGSCKYLKRDEAIEQGWKSPKRLDELSPTDMPNTDPTLASNSLLASVLVYSAVMPWLSG